MANSFCRTAPVQNRKLITAIQWVTVEVEVRGMVLSNTIIDGQVVLQYSEPQLDERDEHAKALAVAKGTVKLDGGYISLQSESHPVDFRKVELLVWSLEVVAGKLLVEVVCGRLWRAILRTERLFVDGSGEPSYGAERLIVDGSGEPSYGLEVVCGRLWRAILRAGLETLLLSALYECWSASNYY